MMQPASAASTKKGHVSFGPLAGVTVQLFFVLLVMFLYQIEVLRGMKYLLPLIGLGFVANALLPLRFRMAFFLMVSVASVFITLGVNSLNLFAIGLVLIGICHLPIPVLARAVILGGIGGLLGAIHAGQIRFDLAAAVIPALAGMFMFRLAIYLYDIRNEKQPTSIFARLAYFFMIPNVCFPFFPVVDYRAFLRSHYATDALETYQKGVQWILRGCIHLLVYRLIYQEFSLLPSDVDTFWQVVGYMLATYLLYLRISGLFHLIVGILCLFGFNLAETHHLYYLANSFSDFWRRINIYWKDFMVKLFYYPVYMRARRFGNDTAMIVATIVVFIGTWQLHAYQFFWLRGTYHLSTVDTLFWAFLCVMVIINSLYQSRRGRKASLGKPQWSTSKALRISAQTVGFFTFITILWTFWSSTTISEFSMLLNVAGEGSPLDFAVFAGILGAAIALGVVIQYVQHTGWTLFAKDTRPWYMRPAYTTFAMALLLTALGVPEVDELLGPDAGRFLVKHDRLNKRDEQLLERGYYEGLLGGNKWNSKVWEARLAEPPEDWIPFGESDAIEDIPGITRFRLKPSHESIHGRVVIKSNQWSMRDQEYTQEKPDGVYRILFLGASYEMGFAIEQEFIYEAVAENILNETIVPGTVSKVEILNLGVPGYGAIQWAEDAQTRIEQFRPDCVMVTSHTGDVFRTTGFITKALHKGIELPPFFADIADRAGLEARMSEAEIQRRLNRRRVTGLSFAYEIYDWAYKEIADYCTKFGAVPVWLFIPRSEAGAKGGVEKADQQRLAEKYGFVILGLDDTFESVKDFTKIQVAPWDRHPNADGHKMLGKKLAEVILSNRDALKLDIQLKDKSNKPAGD